MFLVRDDSKRTKCVYVYMLGTSAFIRGAYLVGSWSGRIQKMRTEHDKSDA